MTQRQRTLWSGLLFLGFGAATFYIALGYKLWVGRAVGSGLFPAGLGAIIAVLGVVLIVQSRLEARGEPSPPWKLRPILAICGSLVAFALLVDRTGLLIALAAAAIIAGYADKPRFFHLAVVYVVIVAFVYVFMMRVLNLPYKLY